MDRTEGFYWIKWLPDSDWQVARWNGKLFRLTGSIERWYEHELFLIHEQRINEP